MRSSRIVLTCAVLNLVLSSAVARVYSQAADPMMGTWTLDVAKSKGSQGPGPKSATLVISESAEGTKTVLDLVTADGQAIHEEITAKADGKDYPVTGSRMMDTVSITRNGNARTRVDKKAGKVVMTHDVMLSADGKTFTMQRKGTDAKGQAVNNTTVYVKKM